MEKLSVVIITFNEEKNIERCLKSVQSIADEIVVLDSFSTDKTKEICESFGVRFSAHKFDGHIQQKNRALALASNEWVLSLDADEAPDEELLNSIKQALENPTAEAYYFNRLTNYLGKWIRHSGWYPDQKLRLLKNSKGKWAGINPHDKIEMLDGIKPQYLKGELLHYSYYSIEQHIDQINKFTTIGAFEAHKKGRKSNMAIASIKSFWKFVRDYFFKLGILDGYYGFVICSLSAWATFNKYLKLRELIKNDA
ncbi:MAG: glycosyltransferase family 2 protein [Bacteroidetes bacterium]|nr:MAG: glycosyltransferase family 2 protein [Bacteroidota bacterium]